MTKLLNRTRDVLVVYGHYLYVESWHKRHEEILSICLIKCIENVREKYKAKTPITALNTLHVL